MWFRRVFKAQTINTIIQMPPQSKDSLQQEVPSTLHVTAKKITIIKFCIFSLWIPITVLFLILIQICLTQNVFKITREVCIGLLGPLVISAGFAQTTHYSLYQLRDSKSLAQIRSSINWIVSETTQIMVVLLVYLALCFGLINAFSDEPNKILFSIEVSLYITSIQCLIFGFFHANKLGVYT